MKELMQREINKEGPHNSEPYPSFLKTPESMRQRMAKKMNPLMVSVNISRDMPYSSKTK